jgi:hypothetical protein
MRSQERKEEIEARKEAENCLSLNDDACIYINTCFSVIKALAHALAYDESSQKGGEWVKGEGKSY